MHGTPHLTPALLLRAYAEGIFPMAERREDDALYWVSPERRGIIPLDAFHVPRRLARVVKNDRFRVTSDRAFGDVMRACAAPRPGQSQTWINAEIIRLYSALYASGHAHSIECWREGHLAGGLYGVHLGGAFFGESMFSFETDASKVALVYLVALLRQCGFRLLDTQFLTAHLARFGAVEIPRAAYLERLGRALAANAYWPAPSGSAGVSSLSDESGDVTLFGACDWVALGVAPGALVLQLITQTS